MTKKYTILQEKYQQEMNLLNLAPEYLRDNSFRKRKRELQKLIKEVLQVRRDLERGQKLFGIVA